MSLRLALGLTLSPAFWVAVILGALVLAQFRIYHRDRLTRSSAEEELRGPNLPQWATWGISAGGNGTWATAIGHATAATPPTASTTAAYSEICEQILAATNLTEADVRRRAFGDGFEINYPLDDGIPTFRAQLSLRGFVTVELQWRLNDDPIAIAGVLHRLNLALETLTGGACARALGKQPWYVLSLSNWPEHGVSAEGLLQARKWTEDYHREYTVTRSFRLGGKRVAPWELVRRFAQAVLADAGYVGFEAELAQQGPGNVAPGVSKVD